LGGALHVTVVGRETTVAESVAGNASPNPPPDSSTRFRTGEAALVATFPVTVIAGKLAPAARTSLRVQVSVTELAIHVHPGPAIDTRLKPGCVVSVTSTVPLVGAPEAAFDTVTVNVAPVCPCVKFPTCVLLMLREVTVKYHSLDEAITSPFALNALTYHP